MKKIFLFMCDSFFLLRVYLLIPVWTGLLLGWISATSKATIGGWIFNPQINGNSENCLWIALTGLSFIAASMFVINQIIDIESDRINNKLFILPHGLLSTRTAWFWAILSALVGLAISIVYFDLIMVILFSCGVIFGLGYSLPPLSLKNSAWGGVFINFLVHGVVTFLVGWYAANYGRDWQEIPFTRGIIASLTAGFAYAAVYLNTTIVDIEGDRSTGKRTFCVSYGEKNTGITASLFCAAALFLSFSFEYNAWVMVVQSFLSLILFVIYNFFPRRTILFKTFRWPVILLSVFMALFIPIYILLILGTFLVSRLYYVKRFNYFYPTFKSE